MQPILNDKEKIKKFIQDFLPPTPHMRKSDRNHISTISETINRVFRRYFGFTKRVEDRVILEAFSDLNYKIKSEEGAIYVKPGLKIYTSVHVNVSSDNLRLLRITTIQIPKETSEEKALKVKKLINQLTNYHLY